MVEAPASVQLKPDVLTVTPEGGLAVPANVGAPP